MAKTTLAALAAEGDIDLSSLSPDQRVILQIVGRALAELNNTFDQVHLDNMRVLESIQQMQASHEVILDNIPKDLTKPTSTDEYHIIKNRVNVIWIAAVRFLALLGASLLGLMSFLASQMWDKTMH